MSMNFGREQALLRQRLTAKGSEELAAEQAAQHGDNLKFLGADDQEVLAAATDLAELYPDMGRAQMTAFVRTLWGSKTHELRCVGIEILAMRASLLEPPDMPFVEGLLKDATIEALNERIASDVLGPLVCKNKKLWKDLHKLAKGANEQLRRAAVRAAKAPVTTDSTVFPRFEKLVTPLLEEADTQLQAAIDEVLAAAVETHADAVQAFAKEHARKVKTK
tara:strand:+ start:99511 stop:100170 length:660 start_codon:yes stop_codon:yes gene_type:complete